jgi:hypothetical protein
MDFQFVPTLKTLTPTGCVSQIMVERLHSFGNSKGRKAPLALPSPPQRGRGLDERYFPLRIHLV